ncbi:hypothetical protein HELRODRAFT_176228 [Helobdella robusta]|uniref:Uncharacterized protein n=1 Tax=Helobdella robusta TaxID=6412 RepID=T1FAB4_HELRO|nr:hypothetical protein HELRODRAFT_176228 [Helobdella robusta]ESN99932.1 hypothetical protein HELRODRAFT_176228 [Helobdella robusta]
MDSNQHVFACGKVHCVQSSSLHSSIARGFNPTDSRTSDAVFKKCSELLVSLKKELRNADDICLKYLFDLFCQCVLLTSSNIQISQKIIQIVGLISRSQNNKISNNSINNINNNNDKGYCGDYDVTCKDGFNRVWDSMGKIFDEKNEKLDKDDFYNLRLC